MNAIICHAASQRNIPLQRDVRGRDTGTDAMGGVFGNVDCMATSVGFPIRNMHTQSELAHTGDVEACIEILYVASYHVVEKIFVTVLCGIFVNPSLS